MAESFLSFEFGLKCHLLKRPLATLYNVRSPNYSVTFSTSFFLVIITLWNDFIYRFTCLSSAFLQLALQLSWGRDHICPACRRNLPHTRASVVSLSLGRLDLLCRSLWDLLFGIMWVRMFEEKGSHWCSMGWERRGNGGPQTRGCEITAPSRPGWHNGNDNSPHNTQNTFPSIISFGTHNSLIQVSIILPNIENLWGHKRQTDLTKITQLANGDALPRTVLCAGHLELKHVSCPPGFHISKRHRHINNGS